MLRRCVAAVWVCLLVAAFPTGAQIPLGPQLQVNTTTARAQVEPAVALSQAGQIIVVWVSDSSAGTDSSSTSIQGQRLTLGSVPLGGELQLNRITQGAQELPDVATSPSGRFMVVWSSESSGGDDSSHRSVQAQLLGPDGALLGGQGQVNTSTRNMQSFPAVDTTPDSGYVVVWHSHDSLGDDQSARSIQLQRYDGDGTPLGGEQQVNTITEREQLDPAVAVCPDGSFLVVWADTSQPELAREIRAQRFDLSGNPLGSELTVNSDAPAFQYDPDVAAGAGCDLLVVWASNRSAGSDDSGFSIQGRLIDAAGQLVGEDFQVNTFTLSDQDMPAVAAEPTGGFVVVWRSGTLAEDGADGNLAGISAQRIDRSGSLRGPELVVNQLTTGVQSRPAVAAAANGDLVFAWDSSFSPEDDDEESVHARVFARDATLGPEAWFRWSPVRPEVGDEVQLIDASAGPLSAWSWDFGDGSGAATPSPSHVYTAAGAHRVTLEVTGAYGTDSVTRMIAVTDRPEPGANADLAIPAAAHVNGSGAFFTSRVDMFNAGADELLLEIVFTPRQDLGGEPRVVTVNLAPGIMHEIEDPLGEWFGFDEDDAVGSLLLTVLEGEPEDLMVQSVVLASNPDGTEYGQLFSASRPAEALTAGDLAHLSTTVDALRTRVNVGVLALADGTDLAITPVDPIGSPIGRTLTLQLDLGENLQVNDAHGVFGIEARADFLLEVLVNSGRATPYASVLDGRGDSPGTNDPTTILPLGSGTEVVLLELGSVQGLDEFAGSASITNLSPASTTVQAELHQRGVPGIAAAAEVGISGGDTRGFADLVGELFGLNTVGTVVLRCTDDGAIAATGREFAVFRDDHGKITGTAGQLMPGLHPEDLLVPGRTAHFLGLRHADAGDGVERSHLALFNPGSSAGEVQITLFDGASGEPGGSACHTVAAGELMRVNSVVERVAASNDGRTKRLQVTTSVPVYVLAYRVNSNGDPVTLIPIVR